MWFQSLKKEDLRNFIGIVDMPFDYQVYEFLSRFTSKRYMDCALGILNNVYKHRARGKAFIIVDPTDIQVDLTQKS